MKLPKVSRSLNNSRLFSLCCGMTESWLYAQPIWCQGRPLLDVVKLFCCLFAVMDKVLGLFFLLSASFSLFFFFLEATLDTLVCVMADVPAVFVASHHWLCLSTVALSALLLSTAMHTLKKKKKDDMTCFRCATAGWAVFFHHKHTAGCSWARLRSLTVRTFSFRLLYVVLFPLLE